VAATEVPAGLQLTAIDGQQRPIDEWLITFQILGVVLDPFTYESAWLLETAGRILDVYRGASVRTAFIVTSTAEEARQFLGPWLERVIVYVDADRAFVRGCELEELPALVHVRQDRSLAGVAQGWDPAAWRAVTNEVSKERSWTKPAMGVRSDPVPFRGSPALAEPAATE
jgi:hypothetical protein